uniref:Uncharacterized protein n=1 Tax=Xenopus tropicalis TaxID=8364 RepID=A0A1B8Y1A8_XENTR
MMSQAPFCARLAESADASQIALAASLPDLAKKAFNSYPSFYSIQSTPTKHSGCCCGHFTVADTTSRTPQHLYPDNKMADAGWDGWEELDMPRVKYPFSFREPDKVKLEPRYTWAGNFGIRVIRDNIHLVTPYCGKCGQALIKEFDKFSSICPHCSKECWNGPFNVVVEPEDSEPASSVVSALDSVSPKAIAATDTEIKGEATPPVDTTEPPIESPTEPNKEFATAPECAPITGLSPSHLRKPSYTIARRKGTFPMSVSEVYGSQPGEGPLIMGSSDSDAAENKPPARGRGRGRGSSRPSPTLGVSPSGSVLDTPAEQSAPESVPGWGDQDDPPETQQTDTTATTSTKVGPSSERHLAIRRFPDVDESTFWVLPGRANPEVFRTVSRVQQIINFRVRDLYGYFMPYAPEWVFDKVDRHLEEWLYGELCRREDIGPAGLFHANPKKREKDLTYLCDTVNEWWYGRTIMKHFVKSCGKYSEEKHFCINALLPSGARIDKPHPRYYISYEDTVERFGTLV